MCVYISVTVCPSVCVCMFIFMSLSMSVRACVLVYVHACIHVYGSLSVELLSLIVSSINFLSSVVKFCYQFCVAFVCRLAWRSWVLRSYPTDPSLLS